MIYRRVATNFTSGKRRTKYKQGAWVMRNRLPTKRYLRNLGRFDDDPVTGYWWEPKAGTRQCLCMVEKISLQHNLQDARHIWGRSNKRTESHLPLHESFLPWLFEVLQYFISNRKHWVWIGLATGHRWTGEKPPVISRVNRFIPRGSLVRVNGRGSQDQQDCHIRSLILCWVMAIQEGLQDQNFGFAWRK